ncbi:MAG: 5-formyltetrahydrofolate cyclo-ligase, partial [Nitrospinales bacterium]
MDKTSIRKKIIGLRNALDLETVRENSEKISRNLFACGEFIKSRHLMAYMSLDKEVQTESIIKKSLEMGKKVYLPVVDKNKSELKITELPGLDIEFESGPFGIREPAKKELRLTSPTVLDCVIIPGVAFDANGGRLGFG